MSRAAFSFLSDNPRATSLFDSLCLMINAGYFGHQPYLIRRKASEIFVKRTSSHLKLEQQKLIKNGNKKTHTTLPCCLFEVHEKRPKLAILGPNLNHISFQKALMCEGKGYAFRLLFIYFNALEFTRSKSSLSLEVS